MEAANSSEMSILQLITNLHNVIYEKSSVSINEGVKTSNHNLIHLTLKLGSM